MSPAVQRLHALWYQPGREMDASWWKVIELDAWRDTYDHEPMVRPSLDKVIARRLGHEQPLPSLAAIAEPLLADDRFRQTLCIALGLWAFRCPDYLLLKQYRTVLLPILGNRTLVQLHALLPLGGRSADLSPDVLAERASGMGAAWLASSSVPALRLCRLTWPSPLVSPPLQPVEPILQKFLKWF